MNMTSEQGNSLTASANIKKISEDFIKLTSAQQKQAKDLQIQESIFVAGITWNKFSEDADGNAYMLADNNICDMIFGNNNDWRESPIRKKLNNELYHSVIAELGLHSLVTIQTDLFSHDGLRDYGKCEDNISLLTYDMYRNNREYIKGLDELWWTCTPDSTPSGNNPRYVRFVDYDGCVGYGDCGCTGGVRPFFILKSDIFVSCGNTSWD